ncbi:MAG: acyltransferase [Candidatus Heimdallarchaeota archaeon]|nr:acyltransferase [Candidatus Heimdallarchaeota archaeon]
MNRHRFYELDFLRFLAALSVLMFHYTFRMWNVDGSGYTEFPVLGVFSKYGYLGVDIFFLISGFVIIMSADGRKASEFGISRIVRLYPAYWFCTILISFLQSMDLTNTRAHGMLEFVANMTMLQTWLGIPHIHTVYWTLAVELQFYFIVAFMLYFGLLKRLPELLGGWLLISILVYYIDAPDWFRDLIISKWSHYFIAGASFYLIWRDGFTLYKLALILVSLLQALKLGYWYVLLNEKTSGADFEPLVALVLIASFFALFFMIAIKKIPDNFRMLAKLGVLTYPLYMIHIIAEPLLEQFLPYLNRFFLLLLVTSLVMYLAWLIHRFIEKPFAPKLKVALQKTTK